LSVLRADAVAVSVGNLDVSRRDVAGEIVEHAVELDDDDVIE
jgi:hypothetical protein